LIFLIRYL